MVCKEVCLVFVQRSYNWSCYLNMWIWPCSLIFYLFAFISMSFLFKKLQFSRRRSWRRTRGQRKLEKLLQTRMIHSNGSSWCSKLAIWIMGIQTVSKISGMSHSSLCSSRHESERSAKIFSLFSCVGVRWSTPTRMKQRPIRKTHVLDGPLNWRHLFRTPMIRRADGWLTTGVR